MDEQEKDLWHKVDETLAAKPLSPLNEIIATAYPPAEPMSLMKDPEPRYGLSAADKIARVKTLGASEIAAVAGIHPYANALDVFLNKVGRPLARDPELEAFAEWGHRLEPMIAKKYADEHQVELIQAERRVHDSQQWMSATPDRLVLRNWGNHFLAAPEIDRGLELKNRNEHVIDEFGENGSDVIPMDVAAQCHWSMEVWQLEVWDVAVLLGGNKWRWYRIHRDPEIISVLMERGYDFWHNNVLKGIEPAIDGSASWTRYITEKFGKHTDVMREGTAETYNFFTQRASVIEQLKDLEKDKAYLENILKAEVGDAAGIQWPDGSKFTWKQIADTKGTDYEAIALELAAKAGLTMEQQKELVAQHQVVTKAGYRRIYAHTPQEKK